MPFILLIIVVLALVFGPRWWVQRVMTRYQQPSDRYRHRGTGGELARHLLDRLGLAEVGVEISDHGDHYDPDSHTVRLSSHHYHGYSLVAVTVAAHEVGHAIQDRDHYPPFVWRGQMARTAQRGERLGAALMMGLPVVMAALRLPQAGAVMGLVAIASLGSVTLVHLVTLPVEWDASFNKAYPILVEGEYLQTADQAAARRILQAAALTYVAQSLWSLLNVIRWLRVLRR